jgi:protein O-mannosyl-transferase
VIEKIPLFLLSLGSAAITVYAQRDVGALGTTLALPLRLRLSNAIYSYFDYIVKGFSPARLAVFYPHPESSLALWEVAVAAALLGILSALVWRYRERRYLLAGWTWYLVALLPVIGVVQVGRQAMPGPPTASFHIGVTVTRCLHTRCRSPLTTRSRKTI